MILVFDSTTLIYFAKIRVLDKVGKLKITRIIPNSIYKEVVINGKQKGQEDAFYIEKLITKNMFNIKEAKNKKYISHLLSISSLDYADAETLALAKELNGVAVFDETPARTVAEMENIKFHGSIFLLFLVYKNKLISKKEIKLNIDKIIQLGWRCSTELYSTILDEIAKLA